MATSQNGWPVVGAAAVVDRAVLGVEFPNGWLKGDVDIVFTHLIGRLHREVEPIDQGGCWGWFVKTIEGSSTISNHASGTAIDYNAPAHPLGRRNTYSASDQAKIRAILADLGGVVRWGGDYTGRPDDMHFEIVKGAAAVKAVAARIRKETSVGLTEEDKKWLADRIDKAATAAAERVWNYRLLRPDSPTQATSSAGTYQRYTDVVIHESEARLKAMAAENHAVVMAALRPASPPAE